MKKRILFRSEQRLGYLLVTPALLLISLIALYPILQSFWYSLFDLRLNNPTRNNLYLKTTFNVEKWTENYSDALNAFKAVRDVPGYTTGEKNYKDLVSLGDFVMSGKTVSTAYAQTIESRLHNLEQELQKITDSPKYHRSLLKAKGSISELEDSIITSNFVGFANYSYYFGNKRFYRILGFTLFFTVATVALELILGLIVAVVINRDFRGRGLVRAFVLIPWAIPTVVSALMWQFLYDGQNGFMSHLFAALHLIKNSGVLLTTHSGATFALLFADVWKTTPYIALLLFAGLQGIDKSLYEAAEVDGANKGFCFFRITLPLLKSTILVALLFRTLDAFRVFDLVKVLTNGANDTETISTYAYKTMFSQMEFGRGATLSVIVFICVALISICYIKVLGATVMTNSGSQRKKQGV